MAQGRCFILSAFPCHVSISSESLGITPFKRAAFASPASSSALLCDHGEALQRRARSPHHLAVPAHGAPAFCAGWRRFLRFTCVIPCGSLFPLEGSAARRIGPTRRIRQRRWNCHFKPTVSARPKPTVSARPKALPEDGRTGFLGARPAALSGTRRATPFSPREFAT
jgi:hypothetical protein